MKLSAKLMLAPAVSGGVMLLTLGVALGVLGHARGESEAAHARSLASVARIAEQQDVLGDVQVGLYRTMSIVGSMEGKAVDSYRADLARQLKGVAVAARQAAAETDPAVTVPVAASSAGPAAKAATVTIAATASADLADPKGMAADYLLLAQLTERCLKAADAAVDLATVDPNTGVAALQTADSEFTALDQVRLRLQKRAAALSDQTSAALGRQAQTITGVLALLGLLAAAAATTFAWALQRRVLKDVRHGAQTAARVAAGHLDEIPQAHSTDELGDLLRALGLMVGQLRGTVTSVQQVSETIGVAAREIASGNQDLSQRTEQTASNLQQTASSMEQLTGTVKQSADSAATANQLANSAADVAQRGGEVVAQVVNTMEEIATASRKIADIIGVIDGIAFQTNILALNAAVEAARAGEQGRGFAVVAGEVRSLAHRSAEAAREIKRLIGSSVDRVEAGARQVQEAGTTMDEIVASVRRVSDIVGEISAAAHEQSQGIGQVNSAVSDLDRMTQQNAALVEESAAAADSLSQQAGVLSQAVSAFKLQA